MKKLITLSVVVLVSGTGANSLNSATRPHSAPATAVMAADSLAQATQKLQHCAQQINDSLLTLNP